MTNNCPECRALRHMSYGHPRYSLVTFTAHKRRFKDFSDALAWLHIAAFLCGFAIVLESRNERTRVSSLRCYINSCPWRCIVKELLDPVSTTDNKYEHGHKQGLLFVPATILSRMSIVLLRFGWMLIVISPIVVIVAILKRI
ncbi:hypothetical protein BX616_005290 [Lobosporangium transversale]|uniref:Uncharacterized protein n=1 Tax=Lobosporangium transversale TaxID=64571 RepID=A0A1Y2H3U7_9FUNG|nr:hypothetical protein BCR41DRAFT_119386 [Lobosporangium transversale]KAF9915818.1 hypothetical protein BX616_005290 [Lobosporangium transversale]ORZ27732.1 hypothetical protein BCR41DRAFT_119386 [Lobosporangium transversale]|eukprot:XP_021885435.1 hypothetical protein BCR41DRAFT_119386 [Lobosporangium transversale]